MMPTYTSLRSTLKTIIANRRADGHVVDGLHEELQHVPDSYDALDLFARRLAALPLRSDWTYVEPDNWKAILQECDPDRPTGPIGSIDLKEASIRVETAFLSSVCGCMVGKPLECNPTLAEIRAALEKIGEWPLCDYISRELQIPGKQLHGSSAETCREVLAYAASDDDINYTILGMLNLEQNGADFTLDQLRKLWGWHISLAQTWGPERTMFVKAGIQHLDEKGSAPDYEEWTKLWNPNDQACGALIRADAYGYACPGDPALAAKLAWRDASFTHRKTGVYGTMFVAAAIATAFVESDPVEVFRTAVKFVPQRSRFYQIVSDSLREVEEASDWLDGYDRIHGKYKEFSHCQIYQECGTLINTLRFAKSIDDGFCKQVSQGNDTDSFGATAGSILGVYFGPDHLDPRWLRPLNDEIRTGLSFFYERSLSGLARRMGQLPGKIGLAR